jgi:uncharacterized protein YjbI with pentapeptide repeats
VCLAVTGGVAIVLLATWILGRLLHPSHKEADPIDITKLSFTVAGGVGAAVALVVAYRRQRDVEQGRFVERFGAAAAQLGDHDVAVRIAGVYAMAGVADESTGLRRQQCIDVLCGYLRLPYSPELGSSHQTKLVLTQQRTGDDGSPLGQQEEHLEYRQNDKEVRATIVRVIADHLRHHEYSWSGCDFDFRTAHLEDVSFVGAMFGGFTQFDNAKFSGDAVFAESTFSRDAVFAESAFSGDTAFYGATFSGGAGFHGATFSRDAGFGGATFSRGAWFPKASFAGDASFGEATFSGEARFGEATFSGLAWFVEATFSGEARFDKAAFAGDASFDEAAFSDASFDRAAFSGSDTSFAAATFAGEAAFDNATFRGDEASFGGVTFAGGAVFGEATFSGDAEFGGATFSGPTSFVATDFGSGAIAFENPRQWGPPAPTFDWDGDPSTKPENVTPQSWPPTPVA